VGEESATEVYEQREVLDQTRERNYG